MKTESMSIASTVTCARNFLLEAENYMDVKDSYRDSVNKLIQIAEEHALSPVEPEISVKPLSLKELKVLKDLRKQIETESEAWLKNAESFVNFSRLEEANGIQINEPGSE